MTNACVRVPGLEEAEVVKLVNGPEAFTPDGEFILFTLNPPGVYVTLSVAAPNRLCIVRAEGTGLTCVVDSRDQKTWPDWTH